MKQMKTQILNLKKLKIKILIRYLTLFFISSSLSYFKSHFNNIYYHVPNRYRVENYFNKIGGELLLFKLFFPNLIIYISMYRICC
jgi:hypothetical protein